MSWDEHAAAWAVQHGGYDARRAPDLVRLWLRAGYGVARLLSLLRVGPAAVALAGLLLAAAVPLVAPGGAGRLLAAAGLVLLSALAGTVARALALVAVRASPRAAIREAVADRLGEVAWLVGFWVAGASGVVVLVGAALTGLHEYVRVQAFAAGMSRIGAQTVAERPARAAVAVAGLVLAGLAGLAGLGGGQLGPGVLTVTATAWLLLALVGLGQLTSAVRRSLR